MTDAPVELPQHNAAFVDDTAAPVPVAFGGCPCPGTPHPDGDTIWLKAALDMDGGLAFASAFASSVELPIDQALGRSYLIAGIANWTFVDAKGVVIPVTPVNISKLRWSPAVAEMADKAAGLYGKDVLLPLVARAQASSPNGRAGRSTSPRRRSSGTRRKRS